MIQVWSDICKPQSTQTSSEYLSCCPCALTDEWHTSESIHSICLLCLRLVAADWLLMQTGWSELNMGELMVGEDNLSKNSQKHTVTTRFSLPLIQCINWENSLHKNRDWLLLISCWLGMLFGIWDAPECSLCGRNWSWEDKVNRKKFQTTDISDKGTSISFASMYFYFSF